MHLYKTYQSVWDLVSQDIYSVCNTQLSFIIKYIFSTRYCVLLNSCAVKINAWQFWLLSHFKSLGSSCDRSGTRLVGSVGRSFLLILLLFHQMIWQKCHLSKREVGSVNLGKLPAYPCVFFPLLVRKQIFIIKCLCVWTGPEDEAFIKYRYSAAQTSSRQILNFIVNDSYLKKRINGLFPGSRLIHPPSPGQFSEILPTNN